MPLLITLAARLLSCPLPSLVSAFLAPSYPNFDGPITVQHSAIARFYAPSDLCGAGAMYRERIRSNPRWHGYARRDTVLVNVGGPVMGGIIIGVRASQIFQWCDG
ncbi:hypothetical protein B0H13DRAFT_1871178 [Mycena leptocephala]|nr:hypothetical protein B0H13DRAFT_1871178 [Mycena leptocephala]